MKNIIFNHWDCRSESNRSIYHVAGIIVDNLVLYLICFYSVYFDYFMPALFMYITLINSRSLITILHYIIKAVYIRIQSDPNKYDTFYEEKRKELSGSNMRKLYQLVKRKGKLNGTIYIKYPKVYLVCGFYIYKFNILALSPNNREQKYLYFDVEQGHFYMPENKSKWEIEITEDDFVDKDE